MSRHSSYLMENKEEIIRLERKTDPASVLKQAGWCGIKPGMKLLDAGCGSGVVTDILFEMVQPGGEVIGVDFSEERIIYAKENYGEKEGIDFQLHDLRLPLKDIGQFDLIWSRFFLEYFRKESAEIVKNLSKSLKPGGSLCLLDLDHNCLNHYDLPEKIQDIMFRLIKILERDLNFDPYVGRKLYSYLFDLGYRDIHMKLMAHHLFYGKIREDDVFNWIKKLEVVSSRVNGLFKDYPGGQEAFFADFNEFFLDPRRFTYTPLLICKGFKPLES